MELVALASSITCGWLAKGLGSCDGLQRHQRNPSCFHVSMLRSINMLVGAMLGMAYGCHHPESVAHNIHLSRLRGGAKTPSGCLSTISSCLPHPLQSKGPGMDGEGPSMAAVSPLPVAMEE